MSIIAGIEGQILEVTVVGCQKLKDTKWFSKQDPYIVLEYSGTKHRTGGGKNVELQEKFMLTLMEGLRDLKVAVWKSRTFSADDFIGNATIQLQKVLSEGYDDCNCTLQTETGKSAGEVRLILHYGGAHKHNSVPQVGHLPYSPSPYPPASAYPPAPPPCSTYPPPPYPPQPSPYPPASAYPPAPPPCSAYPPLPYPPQPSPYYYPHMQYSQEQSVYPPASAYPHQPSAYPPPSNSAYPHQPSAYPPPANSAYPHQPSAYPPPSTSAYPHQPSAYPPPPNSAYPHQPSAYPPPPTSAYPPVPSAPPYPPQSSSCYYPQVI